MPANVTRCNSVDSSAFRPIPFDRKISELAANLRAVHTAPELKPVKAEGETPKFDSLRYLTQYRESVATNFMSALSNDFKKAYATGDNAQKRNLENVATAVYLAKVHLCSDGRDGLRLDKLINNWLDAIKKGNSKPGCNFSVEQNFNVNQKNKERETYQKAVNELGLFLKESYGAPKKLAKVVKEDVRHRCGEMLSHHGIDIITISDFLDQTAFNAERNIRYSAASVSSSHREGIAFLKQTTLQINSMLNYPNYLREILSHAQKPDTKIPESPYTPQKMAQPAEPGIPQANADVNSPVSGPAPVINLSNIGNPVINIDLGDKLDRLSDRLEKLIDNGNKVYHIHHYPIGECRHVHGSLSEPFNTATLVGTNADSAIDMSNITGSDFAPESTGGQLELSPPLSGIDTVDGLVDPLPLIDTGEGDDKAESLPSAVTVADTSNIADQTGVESSASDLIQPFSIDAEPSFSNNEKTSVSTPSPYSQAVPFSTRSVSAIDSYIAKQERAGNAVTLSQSGLLRSNVVGSDSASYTRQVSRSEKRIDIPFNNLKGSSTSALADQIQSASPDEKENNKTFTSTASITLRQHKKELEFSNSAMSGMQRRSVASLRGASESENAGKQASKAQETELPTASEQIESESSAVKAIRDRIMFFDNRIESRSLHREQLGESRSANAQATGKNNLQGIAEANKTRPYSPFLDEKGYPKAPAILTVDGLHTSKY